MLSVHSIMSCYSVSSNSDTGKLTNEPKPTVAKFKAAVSPEVAQQLAFEQLNQLKDETCAGHQGPVLPRRSKPYHSELSSDEGTVNNNEEMAREILLLRYENQIMKAQLRQYRMKQRKIQQLSCAAIYHDDYLSEVAGATI